MFYKAIFLTFALTISRFGNNQLIRPVTVYKGIIEGVHDYFNNTCIILLHATKSPIETQGLEEGMALHELQVYLSKDQSIRTTAMDFQTFTSRVGSSYFHIKRPLFVILNDSDDVKRDLAEITAWIDMSYPTWLIFFRNTTTIHRFFDNIYVPFDCKFMVIQGDESDTNQEIITEIYQINRDKEIRYARFGTWNSSSGIQTPRLGFYQRRNNLFGQTIRVTSIYDPPGSLIVRDDDGKMVGLGGFFGGIMQLLEENMNCTDSDIDDFGDETSSHWDSNCT